MYLHVCIVVKLNGIILNVHTVMMLIPTWVHYIYWTGCWFAQIPLSSVDQCIIGHTAHSTSPYIFLVHYWSTGTALEPPTGETPQLHHPVPSRAHKSSNGYLWTAYCHAGAPSWYRQTSKTVALWGNIFRFWCHRREIIPATYVLPSNARRRNGQRAMRWNYHL